SFQPKARAQIGETSLEAIGLMQITDYTLKLIQEDSSELRDHFFNIKRDDLFESSINICVGVRWLFRKREIAKYYLKKEPSALELAEEYKGIRNDKSANAEKQRKIFIELSKIYNNTK